VDSVRFGSRVEGQGGARFLVLSELQLKSAGCGCSLLRQTTLNDE
jgi:hypothetical protein